MASTRGPAVVHHANNEIRKDYILPFEVLIAHNRANRPKQKAKPRTPEKATDPFLSGNEHLTSEEIGRVGTDKKWQMRWFENLYPIVTRSAQMPERPYNPFLQSRPAIGFHQVIVGTPLKNRQLMDFTPKQLEDLLKVYAAEIERHLSEQGTKYVMIFKNEGPATGASIVHEHSQLVALPALPPRIEEEVQESARYFRSRKRCVYCDILDMERKSDRLIYENKSFTVIAPYASRFNYEAHIYARKHKSSFQEFLPKDYEGLAEALLFVLKRIKKLSLDYNLEIHYEPISKSYKEKNSGLHFHIEVHPRSQIWSGFEYASGIIINDVSPEQAAKYYTTGR